MKILGAAGEDGEHRAFAGKVDNAEKVRVDVFGYCDKGIQRPAVYGRKTFEENKKEADYNRYLDQH